MGLRLAVAGALALVFAGCARPASPSLPAASADVIVVPGCPSLEDGTVSRCQWRRATWAAELMAQGLGKRVITSGSNVHNRFFESAGIAAALVELGVPAEVISTETQALHTDENIAYALHIADALGCTSVMVAAEGRFQTEGMCAMARRWGWDCTAASPPRWWVRDRLEAGCPAVKTEGEPASSWVPWREREAARAAAEGTRLRPLSPFRYASMAARGERGETVPMPEPPVPEPTLSPDDGC
ncbi:MAG: YdcF family protein [Proteobacteria bacterium]|nr:YdcF family protein [Pseudomonadota bacterium]